MWEPVENLDCPELVKACKNNRKRPRKKNSKKLNNTENASGGSVPEKNVEKLEINLVKFLNFENKENSCWLDSCLTLIANNETFKKTVGNFKTSYINTIITKYHEALTKESLGESRAILRTMQKDTLNYLKEFLKFNKGAPESAFCALLNLIYHDDSAIKNHLSISWCWLKQCNNCNNISKSPIIKKPIITLSKINKFFPERPISIYTCSCKKTQEMTLSFKKLSNCLIFHFENGAGKGKTIPLKFSVNSRDYNLTSLIMYENSQGAGKDHFVTWIRQPFSDKWLEFNDIKSTVTYFSETKPKLKLKNIYICVYETFDNLGKTKCETFDDELSSSNISVEVIDLMEDDEKCTLKETSESPLNCISVEKEFESVHKDAGYHENANMEQREVKKHSVSLYDIQAFDTIEHLNNSPAVHISYNCAFNQNDLTVSSSDNMELESLHKEELPHYENADMEQNEIKKLNNSSAVCSKTISAIDTSHDCAFSDLTVGSNDNSPAQSNYPTAEDPIHDERTVKLNKVMANFLAKRRSESSNKTECLRM